MSLEDSGTGTEIKAVPVRHPGRWAATAVIAVLAAMLVHSVVTNDRFGWSYVKKYALTGPILDGISITLELTAIAMAIGVVGGALLAILRLSPNPVLSSVSWTYIRLFRGTPVLVQILLWYNLAYLYPHL